MKLIILEGQDNLGKTTIIREITKNYKSYIVRKFNNPPKDVPAAFQDNFQQQSFLEEFRFYTSMCKLDLFDHQNSVMIWDRSHLGEQVYGPLYRGTYPTKWLYDLEKLFPFKNAYLIQLQASPKFVIKHEDGHSLTLSDQQLHDFVEMCKSVEDDPHELYKTLELLATDKNWDKLTRIKNIEATLFGYACTYSNIPNKLDVWVESLSGNRFRPIDEIMKEINQFIK